MAMAVQHSPLCQLPTEILDRIVLEVILSTPLEPPSDLLSVLVTCKQIHNVLRYENNSSLYARLFMGMFDVGAARRRFGPKAMISSNLADQLFLYCSVLQDIREGDIYAENIVHILWSMFFMISENDGKNRAQLERAGMDDFINRRVRIMLHDGRGDFRGWPVENPENALALWLMAMSLDEQKLLSENRRRREQLINLVLPFAVVACRYPSALAPANHFHLPLIAEPGKQFPDSVVTAHGPYPLYRDSRAIKYTATHYGQALTICTPLVSTAAKILYFICRQLLPFPIPAHLPVNRSQAIQMGKTHVRPTQADIREFNAFKSVKFPPKTKWDWWADLTAQELRLEDEGIWHHQLKANSAKNDHDWQRLVHCRNLFTTPVAKGPVFKFGSLTGLWHGRLMAPSEPEYLALVRQPDFPVDFSENAPFVTTVPFYMRLREHHCISPNKPMPVGGLDDGFDDGFFNAYYPQVCIKQMHGNVEVSDDYGFVTHYETYVRGVKNSHNEDTCHICIQVRKEAQAKMQMKVDSQSHEVNSTFENMGFSHGLDDSEDYVENTCNGIQDIIVTGSTDVRHGQAWNHYRFYGRVRSWDGLVVIVRVPLIPYLQLDADDFLGRWIFSGYLVGEQNLVGNWRAIGGDVAVPTWENAFVMSRRDD